MFRSYAPNSKKSRSFSRKSRLCVEALEARDCPSAPPGSPAPPQISSFTASVQTGTTVLLSGTISDANPTTARVSFGGVATGSATPNSSGYFSLVEILSKPGMISVMAQDPNGSTSTMLQTTVTDPGLSLSLAATESGPNRTVTVTGQVSSNSGAATGGLTVTLSGVVSASVTTSASGAFSYTGAASALGQIQAAVTDAWGTTFTASTMLSAALPTIVNFQATNNGNNNWTFSGEVQGEDVAGLVVTLSGVPSLNNVSVTVQADGSFSYTVTLQPGENGAVIAQCVDWWGQSSNEASAYVWD